MIYNYKSGRSVKHVSAQDLGEELQRITELGTLSPDVLLKEAKRKRHLLHNAFEWDDTKAGKEYRKQQARQFINSVTIIENSAPPVQAFVNIIHEVEEGIVQEYKPITIILNDPQDSNIMLDQAIRELEAWKERYQGFKEFAAVINEINKMQ